MDDSEESGEKLKRERERERWICIIIFVYRILHIRGPV